MSEDIKVLVCGYGSIAKQHAYNALQIGLDVKIWRQRTDMNPEVIADGYKVCPDIATGLKWCDVVIVATATDKHLEVLNRAIAFGKPTYLEKPVSNNMDGVSKVLSESGDMLIQMGCQLRQHPCLKKLKGLLESGSAGNILTFQFWVGQHLTQWRKTDYKDSYSSNRARGGGALTDLVHELDLVKWLIDKPVQVFADLRSISDLQMEQAEDLANLIIVTENRSSGTVQLDMLSPHWRRGGQIVGDRRIYSWDLKLGVLWEEGEDGKQVIFKVPEDFTMKSLLADHLAEFIDLYSKKLDATISLSDGVRDLELIASAKRSASSQCLEAVHL